MVKLITTSVALAILLVADALSIPFDTTDIYDVPDLPARGLDDWKDTLSADTRRRLGLAVQSLGDEGASAGAFRNDTMMRINLEREAQHLSLVDLSQAFGTTLPVSRTTISWTGDENKLVPERRDAVEAVREGVYLRSGAMTGYKRDDATEEVREGVYLRSGAMTGYKRENAEPVREGAYLRNGTMAGSKRDDDADAEPVREGAYLRSGTMAGSKKRNDAAEPVREGSYLRSGTMAGSKKRDDGLYGALLNREDLALGALERVNIVYRILGEPEITLGEAQEMGSHGDQFLNDYWQTSMHHGSFWKTDQAWGEPNFIEGGQANGFGFTQSSFHKLHCLANIRTILAWHIMGEGENMSRDMTAHAIHCLEYIRWRELINPDLNEEPIDTVDYKGMGIH